MKVNKEYIEGRSIYKIEMDGMERMLLIGALIKYERNVQDMIDAYSDNELVVDSYVELLRHIVELLDDLKGV